MGVRISERLTYANVMATIAVFGVLAGGSAYAVSKIDTSDIARRAVTAKKIDREAVTSGKLASNAVTNAKLAPQSVQTEDFDSFAAGPAIAGLEVDAQGFVLSSFNRVGGEPTVQHPAPGEYRLTIPGTDGDAAFLPYVRSATLIDPFDAPGQISVGRISEACPIHACPEPTLVRTWDTDGNPANRSFAFLIFRG